MPEICLGLRQEYTEDIPKCLRPGIRSGHVLAKLCRANSEFRQGKRLEEAS
jgi:hypothetical protein